ncbi:MAG: hypothetical protein QNJ42_09500 [Crocosphaera sp.]|nr:hypothetical protein [Crocosphaera sp.]
MPTIFSEKKQPKKNNKLYDFLFSPINQKQNQEVKLGLSVTLIFILICSVIAYYDVLTGQYRGEIFNDDLRIYFWLDQFLDPDLFPNDPIADYFKSVTPIAYTFLFSILAKLGITPRFVMQVIPLFLAVFSSAYIFLLSLEILPIIPFAFVTTIVSWMTFFPTDALPRSSFIILFPAFLYYLIRRALLPCLATILLQGLFYTPFIFVLIGVLIVRLFSWKNRKIRISSDKKDYIFSISGIFVAAIVSIVYILSSQDYLPSISGAEAIKLPEFWYPEGRVPYYSDNILDTYIFGWQSGLKPGKLLKSIPLVGWLSLILPLLLCFPSKFSLRNEITQNRVILLNILIASCGLNILAHLVFFKLYYPNRYTRMPLTFLIALSSSLCLFILLRAIWNWCNAQQFTVKVKQAAFIIITLILGGYSLAYPLYFSSRVSPRVVYHLPEIEMFFAAQPKDILVASLEGTPSNNIPIFSQRSTLTAPEFVVPYHPKHYIPMKEKTLDLIEAHYTDDQLKLKKFIQQYQIDFFVIRESTFTPKFFTRSTWFKQWKDIAKKISNEQKLGKIPSLLKFKQNCTDFQSEEWFVVSSKCILRQ